MRAHLLLLAAALGAGACSTSSSDNGGPPADAAAADSPSGSDAPAVLPTDGATPTDAPATDGATPVDAAKPVDAGVDAAHACNSLVNSATSITITQVASNPPTATGGTIADGVYTMTSAVFYTGPGGATGP